MKKYHLILVTILILGSFFVANAAIIITPPIQLKWNCDQNTWICSVTNGAGIFDTKQDCLVQCQEPIRYTCNTNTYQCYQIVSGDYFNFYDCVTNCQAPPTTTTTTTTTTTVPPTTTTTATVPPTITTTTTVLPTTTTTTVSPTTTTTTTVSITTTTTIPTKSLTGAMTSLTEKQDEEKNIINENTITQSELDRKIEERENTQEKQSFLFKVISYIKNFFLRIFE